MYPFASVTDGRFIINDIDTFKKFINALKNNEDIDYDINKLISNFLLKHKPNEKNFLPLMFELYCSKISGIPLYRYNNFGKLNRNDIGADLFSIKMKFIGQCKYYLKTSLHLNDLTSFIDFCDRFPSFSRNLYINNKCELENCVNDVFNVIRISEDDFQKFINSYIENVNCLNVINNPRKIKKNIEPIKISIVKYDGTLSFRAYDGNRTKDNIISITDGTHILETSDMKNITVRSLGNLNLIEGFGSYIYSYSMLMDIRKYCQFDKIPENICVEFILSRKIMRIYSNTDKCISSPYIYLLFQLQMLQTH